MAKPSLAQQLREVSEALEGPARYKDLALALVRDKTGETLLWSGGVWDALEGRYLDERTPSLVATVALEESQVPFTRWLAEFVRDFREGYPRDISLALAAGDRRAGKTFAAYLGQIAAINDVPFLPHTGAPIIGWTISHTYRERAELNDLIASVLPSWFYRGGKAPDYRYEFAHAPPGRHGPHLRNLSADDPDALKQGRADLVLYNEPQKMQARAIVHGLYGTADQAGLTLLAANRPSEHDSHAEWLYDLKEAIDDELRLQAQQHQREPLGAVFFGFKSKDNTKIDQPARRRVARLAAIIDPAQAAADDDDADAPWRKPGDRASVEFDKHRHVALVPELGARDCTQQVLERCGFWGEHDAAAGVDFQDKPHIASTVARFFGDPDAPLVQFVDEHIDKADERRYLDGFFSRFGPLRGYSRSRLAWIGDASGSWQTGKHDGEGERTSFSIWKDEGCEILPPQDPVGDTGRARNPFVDDQLQLWNELLRTDRLRLDPKRCPWLIECAREAKTKRDNGRRRIVQNKYAHALAAALYLVWRVWSRSGEGRPAANDVRIVQVRRRDTTF